jgi:hypothetical protein
MHNSAAVKTFARSLLIASVLSALVVGCAQKRTSPSAQSAAPKPTAAPATALPPIGGGSGGENNDDPAVKKPRFGEAAVYVDGKPVGVIRTTELPVMLKSRIADLGGGYKQTRYGFVDYARAIGVDAKKIKAMHLYGGNRAVVVDRAELTRIGDRITFSFVQGDRGKPAIHWPPVKLNVNTTIDMVSNVAFYVEKEPPALNKDGLFVMPDGTVLEGKVPYAPEEQGNGTRVYVDGALVGTVKRKKLTDDMLVGKDTNTNTNTNTDSAKAKTDDGNKTAAAATTVDKFSLVSYASFLRADAKQVKSVDLVSGDDVIAHLDADAAKKTTFHVPQHNRGQAVVEFPNASRAARVSAIQIYVNSTPPERSIVKIDDAPEAAIGAGRGGNSSDDE